MYAFQKLTSLNLKDNQIGVLGMGKTSQTSKFQNFSF
jgi:hypothetical protein